jgi:hypothetical protein
MSPTTDPSTSASPTGVGTSPSKTSGPPSKSKSKSSAPRRSTPAPQPTPSVQPAAQGAVNVYIAIGNVLLRWDVDPTNADPKELAPYVTSKVLSEFVASFKNMARHGLAYRGTPDKSHLTIITADSSTVTFVDCQTPSRMDPYTQYHIKTGKAVPSRVPPGLHPRAITMLHHGKEWRLSSDIPDLGRTCKP